MKIKTADLIDIALDWAVTVAEGLGPIMRHDYMKAKAAANNYKGDLAWQLGVTPNDPITVDETGVTHALRSYSEQWSRGGPILEQEGINLFKHNKLNESQPDVWCAHKVVPRPNMEGSFNSCALALDGPTPLIAAMRCFVAATLGDEVEIPDELMKYTCDIIDYKEK